jgi:transcriptional regulator GlxA family with amidase domain
MARLEPRRARSLPAPAARVCAVEPGELRSQIGFTIGTRHGLGEFARAQIVVVPSWRDPHEPAPASLLAALRRAHKRGALIIGLCLGAYVLAEAGLLDGRRATTHWRWTRLFAERFPRVQLDPAVLYVDDGDVITSAGTAAGIDCCLHVVRKQYGAEASNRIARMLVVPPHRQGGQAQYYRATRDDEGQRYSADPRVELGHASPRSIAQPRLARREGTHEPPYFHSTLPQTHRLYCWAMATWTTLDLGSAPAGNQRSTN